MFDRPVPGERIPRSSVMLAAHIEWADGSVTSNRVRDLSAGGVRIDTELPREPGSQAIVSIGKLQHILATVKWSRGGFTGLAFAEQVNPELARQRVTDGARPATFATPQRPQAAAAGGAPAVGWLAQRPNPYGR